MFLVRGLLRLLVLKSSFFSNLLVTFRAIGGSFSFRHGAEAPVVLPFAHEGIPVEATLLHLFAGKLIRRLPNTVAVSIAVKRTARPCP